MIRVAEHQSVHRYTDFLYSLQHSTDTPVEIPGTGLEGPHITSRFRSIGQRDRRPRILCIPFRGRFQKLTVRLKKADREEEGLCYRVQSPGRDRCERLRVKTIDFVHAVIANPGVI